MSGDKYLISDKSGGYFATFTRREYRDIIVNSLNYCIQKKELVVYDWVIMSNHIHLIITMKTEEGDISAIIRDCKKFTSESNFKSNSGNSGKQKRMAVSGITREERG